MLPTVRRRGVRNIWKDPFEALEREFEQAVNQIWRNGGQREDYLAAYPVDIHEDEDHVYVEAELPGFSKDEVNVTLEAGVLTIGAERKAESARKAEHLRERRFTRVQRSFTLPTSVDESKVDAKLADGVLYLKLQKREEVKPRRIDVK